ncbi:MAG: hypothetical protein ACRELC_06135, partial [Gemmatimonadota bacterium]
MPGARPRRVVLLGPQALEITLGRVREELEREGVMPERAPVATVTAGWQEREGEGDVLDRELGGRGVGLALYARSERVAEEDPEFARAHREMQDRLKVLRRAYDIRLGHLIRAHHELLGVAGHGDDPVLARERDAALDAIRALDARHLERIREIRADLECAFDPSGREAIVRQRREVAEILRDVPAVAIAGGHVAALLNRLRLLDIGAALEGKVVMVTGASSGIGEAAARMIGEAGGTV